MLSKKDLRDLIETTILDIKLTGAVVEKDYYVTQIIHALSEDETAIEKWVGLTRQVIAIERGYDPDDNSLVRHIYDLNAIKLANKINNNFIALANAIVTNDANQFKNRHSEYSANPASEIRESLALLKNKPAWKEHYQKFLVDMVYNPSTAIEYEKAIATIEDISTKVIDSLSYPPS